jgi:uncharacterized membrane protein
MAMSLAWVIGLFFVLAVLVGVAVLVAWAVSTRGVSARPRAISAPASPSTPGTALEILDRRFAAGEIGAEEYKRARDLLGGGGAKT